MKQMSKFHEVLYIFIYFFYFANHKLAGDIHGGPFYSTQQLPDLSQRPWFCKDQHVTI